MAHKKKSKEKLLVEQRAKELRNHLIREGKLSDEYAKEELNMIQLKLLKKGNLNNKRVKIDMTDYNKRRKNGKLSQKFCDWLDENCDKEFNMIMTIN